MRYNNKENTQKTAADLVKRNPKNICNLFINLVKYPNIY